MTLKAVYVQDNDNPTLGPTGKVSYISYLSYYVTFALHKISHREPQIEDSLFVSKAALRCFLQNEKVLRDKRTPLSPIVQQSTVLRVQDSVQSRVESTYHMMRVSIVLTDCNIIIIVGLSCGATQPGRGIGMLYTVLIARHPSCRRGGSALQ